MRDTILAALVGGFTGAIVSALSAFVLQRQLLNRQERFQREQADKERDFQEKLLRMQHRHEEDIARERRNYEKTGIASIHKVGGG